MRSACYSIFCLRMRESAREKYTNTTLAFMDKIKDAKENGKSENNDKECCFWVLQKCYHRRKKGKKPHVAVS